MTKFGEFLQNSLGGNSMTDGLSRLQYPHTPPPPHSGIIRIFLSSIQLIHQVLSKSVHNFLRYHAIYSFWPYLSMVKNHLKIIISRSGSSPKSNQFIIVTHPTCPPNFVQTCPHLLRYPPHRRTNRQTQFSVTCFPALN